MAKDGSARHGQAEVHAGTAQDREAMDGYARRRQRTATLRRSMTESMTFGRSRMPTEPRPPEAGPLLDSADMAPAPASARPNSVAAPILPTLQDVLDKIQQLMMAPGSSIFQKKRADEERESASQVCSAIVDYNTDLQRDLYVILRVYLALIRGGSRYSRFRKLLYAWFHQCQLIATIEAVQHWSFRAHGVHEIFDLLRSEFPCVTDNAGYGLDLRLQAGSTDTYARSQIYTLVIFMVLVSVPGWKAQKENYCEESAEEFSKVSWDLAYILSRPAPEEAPQIPFMGNDVYELLLKRLCNERSSGWQMDETRPLHASWCEDRALAGLAFIGKDYAWALGFTSLTDDNLQDRQLIGFEFRLLNSIRTLLGASLGTLRGERELVVAMNRMFAGFFMSTLIGVLGIWIRHSMREYFPEPTVSD